MTSPKATSASVTRISSLESSSRRFIHPGFAGTKRIPGPADFVLFNCGYRGSGVTKDLAAGSSRTTRKMRATRRRLLAGVATACVVLAGSAAAKEGIRATILSGLPTTAAPGSTITVRWRLQDARREPADLLDAFIRVLGPGGVARVGVPTDAA